MGLFDRQKLFRGEKLTELFPEREPFILYDLAVVIEDSNQIVEGSTVDKVELIVGKEGEPPVLASTLSKAIRDLAYNNVRNKNGKPTADDLPAVCCWKKVETKNSYDNLATVLDMLSPYTGKVTGEFPEFSFKPITVDDNPLVGA
jgi:hypothetical protein